MYTSMNDFGKSSSRARCGRRTNQLCADVRMHKRERRQLK